MVELKDTYLSVQYIRCNTKAFKGVTSYVLICLPRYKSTKKEYLSNYRLGYTCGLFSPNFSKWYRIKYDIYK